MWLGDYHSSVVLNYPYEGRKNQQSNGVIITFIEEHDSLDGVFCKAHLLLQSQQRSISIQMRMGGWRKYGRESQLFKVYLGKFLKM